MSRLPGSDTGIRVFLRNVLTQHHVDLSCLQYGAFRGVVRLRGFLRPLHGGAPFTYEAIESMERDVKRIRGVVQVHMHFTNYERDDETGLWRSSDHAVTVTTETDPSLCDDEFGEVQPIELS